MNNYQRSQLTLLSILTFLFASCGTLPNRDDLSLRVSGGAGAAHARGEAVDFMTGETVAESATGTAVGVRVELTKQPDYLHNMTAGLRLQGNLRDVSEDGLGTTGDVSMDLETVGGELHGVLRRYFPIDDSIRPYGEFFGGLAYNDGDLTVSGGGLQGAVTGSGDDWSAVGGLGLGIEFDLSSSANIFIQADYSMRLGEVDPFEFELQDVMVWVGGEIRF